MQKIKKTIVGLAAVIGLIFTPAVASAVTQYPAQGGTWNYGLAGGVRAYSDYLVNRCHGSTVKTDWGNYYTIDTASGYWSNAWHKATPFTNNKYFYRVC